MLVAIPSFGTPGTREFTRERLRFPHSGKICTHNAAVLVKDVPATSRCSMARSTATTPTTLRTKQRRSIPQLFQAAPGSILTAHGPPKVMPRSKHSSLVSPVGQFGQQLICRLRDQPDIWEFVPVLAQRHQNHYGLRRPCRILCYGDSNTAGYTDRGRLYVPYGESLCESLRARGAHCDVGVCGLNGFTARQMIAELGERFVADTHSRSGKGLARILDEDGPIDLVIIMVGTNDLARGVHPVDIVNDIANLHGACHDRGVPTIALAPPFGVSLQRGHKSIQTRKRFVELLPKQLETKEGLLAYFDAEELVPQNCGEFWGDAIHFSASGSRMLGRCLAEWLMPVLRTAGLEEGVPTSTGEDIEHVAPVSGPPKTPRAARARSVSPAATRHGKACITSAPSAQAVESSQSLSVDVGKTRSRSLPPPDGQDVAPLNYGSINTSLSNALQQAEEILSDNIGDNTLYVSRSLSLEPVVRTESSVDFGEPLPRYIRGSPSERRRLLKDGSPGRTVYNEGDAVEVWSNSQQVWCPGRVKKVDGNRVTSEFLLPDNGPAKKILSSKSRELRHS